MTTCSSCEGSGAVEHYWVAYQYEECTDKDKSYTPSDIEKLSILEEVSNLASYKAIFTYRNSEGCITEDVLPESEYKEALKKILDELSLEEREVGMQEVEILSTDIVEYVYSFEGRNYSAFVSPSCGIAQDFDGPTAQKKKNLQETHSAKVKEQSSNLLGRAKLKLASLSMQYISAISLDYVAQCPRCAALDLHTIITRNGSSLAVLRNFYGMTRIETKFQCKTCSDYWTSEKHVNGAVFVFSVMAVPAMYPVMAIAVAPAIASSPLGAKIADLQKKIPFKYKIFAILGLVLALVLTYFLLDSGSSDFNREDNLRQVRELRKAQQLEQVKPPDVQ